MSMLTYSKDRFTDIIEERFQKEIEQYKLEIKVLTLNDLDVIIIVVSNNNNKRINSMVMDTNIKSNPIWNEETGEFDYFINVYEIDIEQFFTKIKKTIFDICLVK